MHTESHVCVFVCTFWFLVCNLSFRSEIKNALRKPESASKIRKSPRTVTGSGTLDLERMMGVEPNVLTPQYTSKY